MHTRSQFCDTALLGLMVMRFMSVPCCGCVSQTERLDKCSILPNVSVMEAINAFQLIAVTHLAAFALRPAIHDQPRRPGEEIF